MTESSRVGTSPMDRQLGRFWLNVGIALTVVAIAGGLVWVWFFP